MHIKEYFHALHVDKTLFVHLGVNIVDEVLTDLTNSGNLLVLNRDGDLPDVYINNKEPFARKGFNKRHLMILYEEGRKLTLSDVQEVRDFIQRQTDFVTFSDVEQHFSSSFSKDTVQSIFKILRGQWRIIYCKPCPSCIC